MAGEQTVIENLSNRKFICVLFIVLCAQVVFFLLGGLIAPQTSDSMEFLLSRCFDRSLGTSNNWFCFGPKNRSCETIPDSNYVLKTGDTREIVFVAQMPHIRDGVQLEYSPWSQSLLGLLIVDLEMHDQKQTLRSNAELMLDIRMGYKSQQDRMGEWQQLTKTTVSRSLDCAVDDQMRAKEINHYNCKPIELFTLNSIDPFYLLNIRIPMCNQRSRKQNCDLGRLDSLRIVGIHQNGAFTKVWLGMKTFLMPVILAAVVWYWNRIFNLARNSYLTEKAILSLGVALAFLDFPLEWLSLCVQIPFMSLITDILQNIFYAMLFSFWLVFIGEHSVMYWRTFNDFDRNKLMNYWKHILPVVISMFCLLVFDLFEQGVHLINPFYSIWSTSIGRWLAFGFILVVSISAGLYLCILGYYIIRANATIKQNRDAIHNKNHKFKFEIALRFQLMMALTLICAALTVAEFIMEQVCKVQLHWGNYHHSPSVKKTSACLTGMFGMWNLYVLLLLAMYAPKQKQDTNIQ